MRIGVRAREILTCVLLYVSHQTWPFPSRVPPPYRWMLFPERNQKVVLDILQRPLSRLQPGYVRTCNSYAF